MIVDIPPISRKICVLWVHERASNFLSSPNDYDLLFTLSEKAYLCKPREGRLLPQPTRGRDSALGV